MITTKKLPVRLLASCWSCLAVFPMSATAGETGSPAAASSWLWQIGQPDGANQEFALAPNRSHEFREDGLFVVGRSDSRRDWPYAHPGPSDSWAGSRQHTFSVVFGIKGEVPAGDCQLQIQLLDAHASSPPALRIEVNGQVFQRPVPRGAGDASIFGDPAKGKRSAVQVNFPARLLKTGGNEISLTTASGSWMLYDWLGLRAPRGIELAEVEGTIVNTLRSAPVLVERNGRLMQTIQVGIRNLGNDTPASILVNGQVATNLTLRAVTQEVEVAVPAVTREQTITVKVEAAGKPLVERSLTLKPVRRWVVYLLPHSHVDIGYTHVQADVEKAQCQYLEMAMETARKTAGNPAGARFKWNVEVLWAVDSYLRRATPEQRQSFIDAVKAGQVGLDALYGNMLTGLCRPEELLRLLRGATVLSQLTGVPIQSAMITDVPGYTWGMVPAFNHSGVKYFSIGPNGGDRIGHTIAAWGDKPFWWVGPNGRDRVLVWMTGTGYYQVFQSPDNLMNYLDRLERDGYAYDYVQVRHCLGDNGAPDVNFAGKVRDWNATHAYPKLVIATTAEMFRDFESRYGGQIPLAKGDFTPYWEDGAGSSARETALNRAAAERLVQAETLFAMVNRHAYKTKDFYQAWRNAILYDEHTWGAHNSISEPDNPFVKSQWAVKQAFALEADRQSRALVVAANESRGPLVGSETGQTGAMDVFNTTGHSVSDALVVIPRELSAAGDAVKSSLTNDWLLPSQRLSSGELVFRASFGAFMGHRFQVTSGAGREPIFQPARASGNQLSSASLTVRIDERTGAIGSLKSSSSGEEWVCANPPAALNDYWYLPGSDLKSLKPSGPATIRVKENGPLIASLLIETSAPGCRKLTREVRLHALKDYVEIIDTLDKEAIRAKEGVHLGFAFNVPEGEMHMDIPWAVMRPEVDQIPGACKNWITIQRWVDVSNKSRGVTWLSPDAPLVEVGGVTANLIGSLSNPRSWLAHLEPTQTWYAWIMNNHWHTNYRAEQEGPTTFRFSIHPHNGGFEPGQATRLALEQSQPLLVLPARGTAPDPTLPQVTWNGAAGTVTTCKPSDDGQALIVRLFGGSGKDSQATLSWPKDRSPNLWLSDNSERALKATQNTVDVPAWSIVTLRAEMEE